MKNSTAYSLLFVFLIFSCGRSSPTLENIDLKKWYEDRNGCLGERNKMADAFKNQKDKLLGLSEQQIINLLSRPDQNELYKRNQKFYYYFLQPSHQCSPVQDGHALQLVIRFNAMGISKEISIE